METTLLPAILSKDPAEVREKIKFFESIPEISEIHIDFADGFFVDNTTVLPSDLRGLETRLRIEAHMLTSNPYQYFHDLEHNGFGTVIMHFESFPKLDDLEVAISNVRALALRAGVAVNPGTDITMLEPLMDKIDIAMIMSVYPGFQGRPFVPESFDKLQALRSRHPNAIIGIDGGVNLDNIQMLKSHGANRFVVGSGIWHNLDPKKAIYEFLEKLK